MGSLVLVLTLLNCVTGSGQLDASYRILWTLTEHAPGAPPHYFVSVNQRLADEKELLRFICLFAEKENLSVAQPFNVSIFYQLDSFVPGPGPYSAEEIAKSLGSYLWRPGVGGRLAVDRIEPDGSRRGHNTKADHTKYCDRDDKGR